MAVDDEHYRYVVPLLDAVPEGKGNGKKMQLRNIDEVAKALQVLPEHLVQFISADLGTRAANSSELRGHWDGASLEGAARKFEDIYIVCIQCEKPELNVRSSENCMLKAKCRSCGWRGRLDQKLQHERVTKNMVQHLTNAKTKWCRNLRGDPAWEVQDEPGLVEEITSRGVLKLKKKKNEKEESSTKDQRISNQDVACELAECVAVAANHDLKSHEKEKGVVSSIHAPENAELPLSQKLSEEDLKERHGQEVADMTVEMHAHVEAIKASVGKGKKAKERVWVAEREAEDRMYKLLLQHQAEMKACFAHAKA